MNQCVKHQRALIYLARQDPVLSGIIRRVGPCTLRRAPSYFLALAKAIVWQQLSWQAATTIYSRLLGVVGTHRPTPRQLLDTSPEALARAGLSKQKIEYLFHLAEHFESGRFPRRRIRSMTDAEVVETLCALRGIGRWSAEMFLIFALNRPDVFPMGDLGLRNALVQHYECQASATLVVLETITNRWKPFRTIGSWYLWAATDSSG